MRWLFNTLSAVSLLLCLAMAALWARSCDVTDFLSRNDGYIETNIASQRGRLLFFHTSCYDKSLPLQDFGKPGAWTHSVGPPPRRMGIIGRSLSPEWSEVIIHFETPPLGGQTSCVSYGSAVSYWLLLTVTVPLPIVWTLTFRRRRVRMRRLANGECVQCGYDLRGSTPGRCPECGATGQERPPRGTDFKGDL